MLRLELGQCSRDLLSQLSAVCIDPGKHWQAGAVHLAGKVWALPLVPTPDPRALGDLRALWGLHGGPLRVLTEWPQVYASTHNKGGDLLHLTYAVGLCVASLAQRGPVEVLAVQPGVWKGSTPKEVHQARAVQMLTPEELVQVSGVLGQTPTSLHHNVLDAVALALWAGRRIP